MKRGCRKRISNPVHFEGESSSNGANGRCPPRIQLLREADAEVDTMGVLENVTQEPGSSRCSLHIIHEVVARFDSEKIRLVEEIGFQGILSLPDIKQFNRRYALWLMCGVDAVSRTLKIGEHIAIKFRKSDVHHVLGIPCNGKPVVDQRLAAREAKDRVIQKFLGPRFKDNRSIKSVQELISREYFGGMTQVEADTFKVAFTVFVVSNLLAPSAKHDYASIDYWEALSDPGSLHTYDWCEFVILKLVEAVVKLKEDIASNIKFPIITGCSVFVQVLYLDSLHIDGLMMRHITFPRIREFSHDRIRLMIAADSNFQRQFFRVEDRPPLMLRDAASCVYSWAYYWRSNRDEPEGASSLALWQCVVAMVNLLEVPLEAAGPVFVAAAHFQNQVNSGMFVGGTQAINFIRVLMSIMIPFKRGHRLDYGGMHGDGCGLLHDLVRDGVRILSEPLRSTRIVNSRKLCLHCSTSMEQASSYDCQGQADYNGAGHREVTIGGLECTEIGDGVERSLNSVLASADTSANFLDVSNTVCTAMSQFYSLICSMKPEGCFDLNKGGTDESNGKSSASVASSSTMGCLPSPWEVGYKWLISGTDTAHISRQVEDLNGVDGMVVVHRSPKFIQISAKDFYVQAVGDCEMEPDLFDVLVRSVSQNDDDMYAQFGFLRWRRFFESDIMACILSGSGGLEGGVFSESMWDDNTVDLLNDCKLMFFPALLQCSWVCFAWVMEQNVIYVFEPSQLAPVDEDRVCLIDRACYQLKLSLDYLIRRRCTGSHRHPQNAAVRLLTLPADVPPRFNRTGAFCYMFCCCFDGSRVVEPFSSVDDAQLAAKICEGGAKLRENSGKFPENFLKCI